MARWIEPPYFTASKPAAQGEVPVSAQCFNMRAAGLSSSPGGVRNVSNSMVVNQHSALGAIFLAWIRPAQSKPTKMVRSR